jgi:hypothetical protein
VSKVLPLWEATFSDPEEGTTATVDRLVQAASYNRVSDSALRSLVLLTALALRSDKVVSMTLPEADVDELEVQKLIRRTAPGKAVLL